MSAGIDYGLGKTNIDLNTGVRYGVIPVHDLDSWIYEELESFYGPPYCPECCDQVVDSETEGDFYCERCKKTYWSEECFPDSPVSQTIDKDGYQAQLDEYNDIFIFKSPYFTYAGFCSPCAPGAGHLRTITPDGVKTYCFGHDWFEGDEAPYPVYSVETGELVKKS